MTKLVEGIFLIITRLIGGLGNQMFQYAIARSLACLSNSELKLDISAFKTYALHKYLLGHFNITENFAKYEETKAFIGRKARIIALFRRSFPFSFGQINHYYIEREQFRYDPDIGKLRGNIYLRGYWQSEKYFRKTEDSIKKDFTVKNPPTNRNKALIEKIRDCNAVAIHVRRGDYVTDSHTYSVHGTCTVDYYRKGINIISKKVETPHFFIFSDDPKWTRENIKINFPTEYISHNGPDQGHEDLRLMSYCKHFIIANSSFSWWGAWLSSNPTKIVIAPTRWFRDNRDTKDLIPKNWIRI